MQGVQPGSAVRVGKADRTDASGDQGKQWLRPYPRYPVQLSTEFEKRVDPRTGQPSFFLYALKFSGICGMRRY